MKDELDPEVFGDLPPAAAKQDAPAPEEQQPQYPTMQTLASGPQGTTQLCADPYREGVQVVQKLINERSSRRFPDLVEHGFARLQGLAHPGLALVRDFGWEGGQAFLVREWVQVANISQTLSKLRPEEISGIIRQLLQVIDYLYSQNTFHLHLKPENLFVVAGRDEGPLLKVTDFGLSEVLHRVIPGKKVLVGTPPFTAPDYATHPVPDIRADLYSVGVLAYWALSRQLPYSGQDGRKILEAQQMGAPKPLEKIAQVPAKLSQWVQSLIQPSAKDRPSDPRKVYREFLSATAAMTLKGSSFPPPIFSDPDLVFRRKTAVKTFRRIVQQGRRWAFQGSQGMGKSFFARWMQRFFWAHGKGAIIYDGRKIAQLVGEVPANPEDTVFILIDQAEQGPVPAWLEARTYPHVIIFGEQLAWAKNDPDWQFLNLEKLDEASLKEIEGDTFGGLPDSTHQTLLRFHQGNPGELVRQARALAREGVIREAGEKWMLREGALQRAIHIPAVGVLGQTLSVLDPQLRPVLNLLSLVQVPLTADTLAEWLDRDAEAIHPSLMDWVREELIVRRVWWGQEFFQSQFPPPQGIPEGVSEDEIQSWVLGLEELGWYRQGKALLERAYSPDKLQRNSELLLIRCRLSGMAGDQQIIFQNITSTFVKDLPPEQQGPAFEILGQALLATGKATQAESAFKKAFAQYRTGQDMAGQTQILMDLGSWYGHLGDNSRAVKFFDQSLAFAEKLPEGSPLLGQVYLEIGRFYERVTDYPRAEEKYFKSIEQFAKHRHYHLLAKAYQNISSLWVRQGEFQQAEYYAREALSIAAFKEDWVTLGATYFVLSQVEESKGNPAGVLERLSEVVFVLERQPQDPLYGEVLVRRANFYEKIRQLDQANKEAGKILALSQANKNELLKAKGYMVRGKVARRDHKRLDEAFNEFRMAQEVFDKIKDAQFSWECAFEMGEIERNRGNAPKARSLYESALNQLNSYVNGLPKPVQEQFLKDGKRDQIEEALKWLH